MRPWQDCDASAGWQRRFCFPAFSVEGKHKSPRWIFGMVSPCNCVLRPEASSSYFDRKLGCSELHFHSIARRKWCDVLECGTREALTLVSPLQNSRNH